MKCKPKKMRMGCLLSLALLLSGCLPASEEAPSTSTLSASLPVASSSSYGGESTSSTGSSELQTPDEQSWGEPENPLQIVVISADGQEILFRLNDSPAAQSLYGQLPLAVQVEDYGAKEKIFYPPDALDTSDTPIAEGPAGTLAYYAPWGNVALFYSTCSGASGLYELGEAVSGTDKLAGLAGEIRIERAAEVADGTSAEPGSAPGNTPSAPGQPEPIPTGEAAPSQGSPQGAQEVDEMKLHLQVGGQTFLATLEENAAVDAFVEMLREAPVVIEMEDYSGFEKVGALGASLPASNSQTTAQAGDIVLYNGSQIVVFYGSNSWSYTRLGRIDDLAGWEAALGSAEVTVTFSIGT